VGEAVGFLEDDAPVAHDEDAATGLVVVWIVAPDEGVDWARKLLFHAIRTPREE
jgi:hypothetical protein